MTTGRLPAKRAGALLIRPEISRPSKLFQVITSCDLKPLVSIALTALVHWVDLPVAGLITKTSPGDRALTMLSTISCDLRRVLTEATVPSGMPLTSTGFSVLPSKARSSCLPRTLRRVDHARIFVFVVIFGSPINVVRYALGQGAHGLALQVIQHQLAKLAIAITDQKDALAVAAKAAAGWLARVLSSAGSSLLR